MRTACCRLHVASWHLEKQNMASLFLAFAVCSRCTVVLPPGPRWWSYEPLLRFCQFRKKWASSPPSHIKLITIGNELRTYDMVPLVSWTEFDDQISTIYQCISCLPFFHFCEQTNMLQNVWKFYMLCTCHIFCLLWTGLPRQEIITFIESQADLWDKVRSHIFSEILSDLNQAGT